MKLGLLAYASKTGLGYQTLGYYKHLKPNKVMLVDLSSLNKMPVYDDWYNFDIRTNGLPTKEEVDKFLNGLDIVLVAETPLNYYLFAEAERRGIKTLLHANPEFFDYFNRPYLPRPSLVALPSLWLADKFKGFNLVNLPVPVDISVLPKREITQAKTFFHIAGRPAIHDRNGTLDFIAAVKLISNRIDAEYIIYAQEITDDIANAINGTGIHLRIAENPSDMYLDGDILVLPRKYGGLCLPAQEAVGAGIPVIMSNISPNNQWLPRDWLVDVGGKFMFMTRLYIDAYTVNHQSLANWIIQLYNDPNQVQRMAATAREISKQLSWDKLLPEYRKVLEDLHEAVS